MILRSRVTFFCSFHRCYIVTLLHCYTVTHTIGDSFLSSSSSRVVVVVYIYIRMVEQALLGRTPSVSQ